MLSAALGSGGGDSKAGEEVLDGKYDDTPNESDDDEEESQARPAVPKRRSKAFGAMLGKMAGGVREMGGGMKAGMGRVTGIMRKQKGKQ